MKSILLTVLGVRVKTVNSRKYQLIDSFSDKGADLYDVIRDVLKLYETDAYEAAEIQEALEVKDLR